MLRRKLTLSFLTFSLFVGQIACNNSGPMNAPAGSVAIHQNVTTCEAVIGSCFDFSGRRKTPSIGLFGQVSSRSFV